MRRTILVGGSALFFLLTGVACEIEPCDDYVDYMCQCHDDEPDFDCAELQRIYAAHTGISDEGVRQLKQALPECEVYR